MNRPTLTARHYQEPIEIRELCGVVLTTPGVELTVTWEQGDMARYSGTCPECGGRWQPGDSIRPTTDWDGSDAWVHAVCPDDPDDLALRRGETVCPSCWLTSCDCEADR